MGILALKYHNIFQWYYKMFIPLNDKGTYMIIILSAPPHMNDGTNIQMHMLHQYMYMYTVFNSIVSW